MKENRGPRWLRRRAARAALLCAIALLLAACRCALAHAQERALIIASGAEDEPAARRAQELLDVPATLLPAPQPQLSERELRALLAANAASYAVILSAAEARVQVVAVDGTRHTRTFASGAQTTAYEAAFVASELVALAREQRPAPEPAAPPRALELAGRAGLELGGFYRGAPMARPSLLFDVRLLPGRDAAGRLVLGAALGLPGRLERQREGVDFTLLRWDALLRLGFEADFVHTRLLAVGEARLARAIARWDGDDGARQHGTSLGFGAAIEAELPVSDWLGLFASLACDVMTRRNLYHLADLVAFHEQGVAWTTGLGLVVRRRAEKPQPARAPAQPLRAH